MALFADEETGQSSHVGIIDPKCNVIAVIQGHAFIVYSLSFTECGLLVNLSDAASNARRLCETYYGDAPEIRYKAIGSPGSRMLCSKISPSICIL